MFKKWFEKRFPNFNGTWMTRSTLEQLLEEAYEQGKFSK